MCQKYVRNREIWDLRWIYKQGIKPNSDLVAKKVRDYSAMNYAPLLTDRLKTISDSVQGKNFYAEMSRFLPVKVQDETLKKSKFLDVLAADVISILSKLELDG